VPAQGRFADGIPGVGRIGIRRSFVASAMTFLAPLALLALPLWLGLAIWALRRRSGQQTRHVPDIRLWQVDSVAATPRLRGRPPIPIVLLLLAALLMILAGARPRLDAWPTRVTGLLLVDRSASMRAGDALEQAQARWQTVADGSGLRVDLQRVEAVDVRDAIPRSPMPVVVLTDRPGDLPEGVLVVPPAQPPKNVAVTKVGVGDDAAVLVDVRSDARVVTGPIRVVLHAGETEVETLVDPPPADGSTQAVLRLPDPGPVGSSVPRAFTIEIMAEDDQWPGDDVARVERRHPMPRLTADGMIPRAVRRFVEAWESSRPRDASAATVDLSRQVVWDETVAEAGPGPVVRVDDDPRLDAMLTAIDWSSLDGLRVAAVPQAGRWRPAVVKGDRWLVATEDGASGRRVWIGFEAADLAGELEFVRFWAAVVEWLAGGEPGWRVTLPARASVPAASAWDEASARRWLRDRSVGVEGSVALTLGGVGLLGLAGWTGRRAVDTPAAQV
jgi:hypothetical protein